jgi:hypothetical protein
VQSLLKIGMMTTPTKQEKTMKYVINTMIAAVFAVIFFVLCASSANAETWVSVMGASYHTDRAAGYNETNPGIGIEQGDKYFRAVLGYYRNSLNRDTFYLGVSQTPFHAGGFSFGYTAGLASGYPHQAPLFVGALVMYERSGYGVNLIAAPALPGTVFTIQLKKAF